MSDAWQLTLEQAAASIAAGELGVGEYVRCLLDRIAATEALVHAWTVVDEDGAMRAARMAEAELARGEYLGLLHGIPFGVKDVIDCTGLPTDGGSRAYRGRVAAQDAAAVARLRAAGAIPLGKTVTHEIAYGQNTPPTRNPWDARRYPGGSSAGSGVAVAVGAAPFALGTDTAGSVRNPASVNGIVGMRPSGGTVDRRGTMHLSERLDQIGPLARTTVDCAAVVGALCGSAAVSPGAVREPLPRASVGIDAAAWKRWGVDDAVGESVRTALRRLGESGIDIVDVELPDWDLAWPVTLLYCLADAMRHHGEALARNPGGFEPGTRVMLELGYAVTSEQLELADRARRRLMRELRKCFHGQGLTAIASPTLAMPPPLLADFATDLTEASDGADLSAALLLLSPASVCGLPAISVPCGFADGLPVGLHLMGAAGTDLDLLRLAHRCEVCIGADRPQPPIRPAATSAEVRR